MATLRSVINNYMAALHSSPSSSSLSVQWRCRRRLGRDSRSSSSADNSPRPEAITTALAPQVQYSPVSCPQPPGNRSMRYQPSTGLTALLGEESTIMTATPDLGPTPPVQKAVGLNQKKFYATVRDDGREECQRGLRHRTIERKVFSSRHMVVMTEEYVHHSRSCVRTQ